MEDRTVIGLNWFYSGISGHTLLRGTNLALKMLPILSIVSPFHRFLRRFFCFIFFRTVSDHISKATPLSCDSASYSISISWLLSGGSDGKLLSSPEP